MKSNKFSTIFLILILLFTLTISVGCGKENEPVEDTRSFAGANLEKFAKRQGLDTAIIYKGQFVGKISINTINWSLKKCEIGYFLDKSFQRNEYNGERYADAGIQV